MALAQRSQSQEQQQETSQSAEEPEGDPMAEDDPNMKGLSSQPPEVDNGNDEVKAHPPPAYCAHWVCDALTGCS